MKAKTRTMKCSCCDGSGRVPFTGEYADTLDWIEANFTRGADFTGAELGKRLGIAATAMNNRLNRLEELGYLISIPYGRKRLYKLR